jgi:hypothetical protein
MEIQPLKNRDYNPQSNKIKRLKKNKKSKKSRKMFKLIRIKKKTIYFALCVVITKEIVYLHLVII